MRRTAERIVVGRIMVDLAGVWLACVVGGFETGGSGSARTGLGGIGGRCLEGLGAVYMFDEEEGGQTGLMVLFE